MKSYGGRRISYGAAIVFAAAVFLALPHAGYAVPNFLNVQGKLMDINDEPKSGEFTFDFRIYNTPSGGSPLWNETKRLNTTGPGFFSTILGSASPLNLSFDEPYYLEIVAGGEVLEPRYTIASTAYSFRSNTTDNLAPNATAPENFFVGGGIAINTTSLDYTLNVRGTANISDTLFAGNISAAGVNSAFVNSTILQLAAGGTLLFPDGIITNSMISSVDFSKVTNFNSGWKTSGNTVYNDTTNVNIGIGTAAPDTPLHIYSTGPAVVKIERGSNALRAATYYAPEGAVSPSNAGWFSGLYPDRNSYSVWSWNGIFDSISFSIRNNGDVGIGTPDPSEKLDVRGSVNVTGQINSTGSFSQTSVIYNAPGGRNESSLYFHDSDGRCASRIYWNGTHMVFTSC